MDVGLLDPPWLEDPILCQTVAADGSRVLQLHVGGRVWDVEVGEGPRCDASTFRHCCVLWDHHDGPHVPGLLIPHRLPFFGPDLYQLVAISISFWWPEDRTIVSMRTSAGHPITIERAS